jgi:hypothetical protein
MPTLGVWIPYRDGGRPGAPAAWPLGRAIGLAASRGVDVVLGGPDGFGTFAGDRLVDGAWRPVVGTPVGAVYDRFPSVGRRAAWDEGLALLAGVPIANGGALVARCTDKLRCQVDLEAAGVAMPEVEGDPGRFAERLVAWGAAFLKPRFGSFGEGVERVEPGAALPRDGAWVLQRAVAPPSGWAGVCLRVLVQRLPSGDWVARTPVVRRSADDPVVNAARGAELVPADAALDGAARRVGIACAEALERAVGGGVELGVDVVADPDGRLWPIEVNGRPRGRLVALAERWPERFAAEHDEACASPLLTLAAWASPGR